MSSREGIIARLIARVRPLLPKDWTGGAGERFRRTTQAISDFAEEHHITPRDLLDDGVELGRRKLEGTANHEFAQALKNFADAEKIKTEVELQRRLIDSDVRKREAEASKANADARLAELAVIQAELELIQKLKKAGIVLSRDPKGKLTALPAPTGFDLMELVDNNRLLDAVLPHRNELIVHVNDRDVVVDPMSIIYATIDNGVITVVTSDFEGRANRRSMEELQAILDREMFWRVHRSYLVNINRIKEVVPWFKSSYQLRMDDKKHTEIPVSRVQTRRLRELFKL